VTHDNRLLQPEVGNERIDTGGRLLQRAWRPARPAVAWQVDRDARHVIAETVDDRPPGGAVEREPDRPPGGAVEREPVQEQSGQVRAAANSALEVLKVTVGRLADAQLLGGRTINDAMLQFHAVCEGLAGVELRGVTSRREAPAMWRQALTALVTGFAAGAGTSTRRGARSRR
jgi:hypothetical protein